MSDLLPALTTAAPANPTVAQLSQSSADAVREVFAEAASANTTRSYATALRYWAAWYQGRYGVVIAMPVDAPCVIQFIIDHLARRSGDAQAWELPPALDVLLVEGKFKQRPGPLKLSTIVHRVAVLSSAHQLLKLANPCESSEVRQLLAKGRRAAHKRGERPSKKTAITATELMAMIATCGEDLVGKRDRALLYFAFASGGRRRSETAHATLSKLAPIDGGYLYHLDVGKTLQDGVKAGGSPDKPLLGPPAEALRAWIEAAGLQEGALFRQLTRGKVGAGLSPKSVATIIQNRARAAGLVGNFGGHSLRSGFVTEGARQGIALPAIMAMTDHRSVVSVIGYYQAGAAETNPAARMLEGAARSTTTAPPPRLPESPTGADS
ncbi:site-specific integrase [Stenotrophomonas sp. GD03993]|uniref:tyrosine-type recombinase/integrase n=1 Tax=unclassified Stenotrophomonas TaxID=196198 RepID=UPI0013136CB5|nr:MULTISPECIES: site-specific integrase [unclassified Stenotrophomonas]MBH1461376.1 site-specific integrase [Stenotrophomonas maltophilia]MDH0187980.1 site-specific integrase [Stenotrophomonas sp. GD04051]MDH0464918.1 site-specific integrase [Stenotrophomonas sp. GD03993]MDH0874978.1 site-specific integrase [Stenotrophomonas sp. GD03877]MDH2155847.1 site-specific integrase [Stenotrophomonas sp. GD03657]